MLAAVLTGCTQSQPKQADANEGEGALEITVHDPYAEQSQPGSQEVGLTQDIVPASIPETETYYEFDSTKAIVIADPITYDVKIKNYIPNDSWEEERLANTNVKAITNALFQAVYKGKLQPYDYVSEQPITIDKVKEMEKKFRRDEIGMVMFTERWFFSENTLQFTKIVTRMTFGYGRLVPETGNTSFSPSFMVKLDEAKK